MNNIITRFAPSPTGYLHIGNIRIALYSWLYAKKYGGKFILRIEDTNFIKYNKKYVDYIFYILEWLGLYWDDSPIYQSDRIFLYKNIIDNMLKNNLAYKCFCSLDRLNNIKNICIKKGLKPKYDGYCRDKEFNNNKESSYVIRFKNPIFGYVKFNDLIYKKLVFSNKSLDDIIIQRSNGLPTYNFCVVVDDYYMSITHVIRGEDHISNTPKQINLIKFLGYNIPNYIHLPIVLDLNGKKLSKRNFSSNIQNYINEGFIPESILNYLFNLGCFYSNEIIYFHEMKNLFNVLNIKKSPCILNIKKMFWLNRYYLNNLSYKKIFNYLNNFSLYKKNILTYIGNISEIISFILPRSNSLKELFNFLIIFNKDISYNKDILYKLINKNVYNVLSFFLKNINIIIFDIKNIKKLFFYLVFKFKYINKKDIYFYIRFFLTGRKSTPNISNIIFLLKKNNVLFRLNFVIKKFFKDF